MFEEAQVSSCATESFLSWKTIKKYLKILKIKMAAEFKLAGKQTLFSQSLKVFFFSIF
jgi:hypothetical protein